MGKELTVIANMMKEYGARLIAAAPEMLEALREFVECGPRPAMPNTGGDRKGDWRCR